jgi:hypothetical protein
MDEPEHDPTAPSCPYCDRADGRLNGIAISRKERRLHYACDACRHTWIVAGPDADQDLIPLHLTATLASRVRWDRPRTLTRRM